MMSGALSYFLRQGLSLNLELAVRAGLVNQQALRIQSWGYRHALQCLTVKGMLGIRAQALKFTHLLRHLLSLIPMLFRTHSLQAHFKKPSEMVSSPMSQMLRSVALLGSVVTVQMLLRNDLSLTLEDSLQPAP